LSSRRLHKVHNTAAPRRVLLFLLFLLFFAAIYQRSTFRPPQKSWAAEDSAI
jgi:hypothetical protein